MIAYEQELILRYRTKGVLLDSNLLVLYFVGLAEPTRIQQFKRTANKGFKEEDFGLLARLSEFFTQIITTPYILTETSNFICELQGQARERALRIIAQTIQSFKERRPESKELVQTDDFTRFGLTDSAVLDLPPKKHLVLSVDAPLVIALQKRGVDAINFNHFRQLNWVL